jgi:hypothetical protein
MREIEILRSGTPPGIRTWFGVAQNDSARRVALTRAMEGRQEVRG